MDVRETSWFKHMLFRFLLVIPLVIPSDWPRDVPEGYGARHERLTYSTLYPEVPAHGANEIPDE
jgi:hypothetical protein